MKGKYEIFDVSEKKNFQAEVAPFGLLMLAQGALKDGQVPVPADEEPPSSSS